MSIDSIISGAEGILGDYSGIITGPIASFLSVWNVFVKFIADFVRVCL